MIVLKLNLSRDMDKNPLKVVSRSHSSPQTAVEMMSERGSEHLYYIEHRRREGETRDDGKNDVYFKTKIWMHEFTFTNNPWLFLNPVFVGGFYFFSFSVKIERREKSKFSQIFTQHFVMLTALKSAFSSPKFKTQDVLLSDGYRSRCSRLLPKIFKFHSKRSTHSFQRSKRFFLLAVCTMTSSFKAP